MYDSESCIILSKKLRCHNLPNFISGVCDLINCKIRTYTNDLYAPIILGTDVGAALAAALVMDGFRAAARAAPTIPRSEILDGIF